MIFDKIGIMNKSTIDPEITNAHYKPYSYTQDDFRESYEKFDVLKIDIEVPFKILNSVLTINGIDYDIATLKIGDVANIFKRYGTVKCFTGYRGILDLPALLLCDATNTWTTVLDGVSSPMDISYREYNKTITSLKATDSSLLVYDKDSNKSKEYVIKNNNIYYEANKNTKIYITTISDQFYLKVDFAPRRVITSESTAYLLNFTIGDTDA